MHAHTDVYAPLRSVPASAGLSVCSVWAAPLLQNVPRVLLFSSLLGGGRGLPQPPPLFRVLDDVLFLGWELADVFFFFGCSCVVVFTPLTGFRLAPWVVCGAAASEKLVALAVELMQPGPLLSTAKQMLWR